MNHWFSDLEGRSVTINESLSLQRDAIERVSERFVALDAHAATVSEHVIGSREISLSLKQKALVMSNLIGRFRITVD